MKAKPLFLRTFIALSLLLAKSGVTAGTNFWTGGGGSQNLFWLSTANWQSGTLPQAGDQLVFTNTVSLLNSNNYTAGFTFGGITFATPAGAFILNGRAVTLTNNITDQQVVTPETINLPLIVNSPFNLDLDVTPNGLLNLNNAISGTGALTNSGGGAVRLNGSNTFAGPLVINAGTVRASQETNLPAAPATPTPGHIVINGGTLQALASFTMNPNHGLALGPTSGAGQGAISVNNQALVPNPLVALSYGGVMANNGNGTGGLTKLGFGNLILSGANTYTGTTSNEVGTLTLDFSQPSAPDSDIINSSSSLVLGGASAGAGITNFAQLVISNAANSTHSQTFNGTHVTVGDAVIRVNPGAGGTASLSLGALDHDPGGTLILLPPTSLGGSGNITTTSGNVNGILGGWATIGSGVIAAGWNRATNWAANDGSGNIVNYTGYTIYNDPAAFVKNSLGAANNVYVDSSVTSNFTNDLNGANSRYDVNSMAFQSLPAGIGFVVGSNNVIRLGRYGGLMKLDTTAGNNWHFGDAGIAGDQTNQISYLTAGGPNDNTPGEIVFINTSTGSGSANNWDIDSVITDNGSGAVTVVLSGSGYIKFRNHNTYSGGTYILGGRLQLAGGDIGTANPDGLGTGPVYVFPGAYLFGTPPSTPVINIAGIGTVQEPDGALRLSGGTTYTNTFVLFGDAGIGGGNAVNPAILSNTITGPYNIYFGAEGNVGGANNGIQLSGVCDWTGNTYIVSRLGGTSSKTRLVMGAPNVLPSGFGRGDLYVGIPSLTTGFQELDLNGYDQTINGLNSGGTTLAMTLSNIVENGASGTTATLTIGNNDASGLWGGIIVDTGYSNAVPNDAITGNHTAITKIGGGVETFTNVNTYTGNTTISNGVLQLIGRGSIANSPNVNIAGGTFDVSALAYTIPAGQTIAVNGGTFFISTAAGSGNPVNFTNGTLKVVSLNSAGAELTVPAVNFGGATNFIQPVNIPPIPVYPQTFPVVSSTSSIGGNPATLGALLPAGYAGFVSNDVAGGQVYLVLTSGPVTPSLTWVGFSGGALNSTWDFVANDWTNIPAHAAASYSDGSLVTFDDSARTNVVSINDDVTPAGVTIANTNLNYTFIGVYGIHGTNGLTKLGPGAAILDNTGVNDFSGGVAIGGGTLQVGNNDAGGGLGGPNPFNGAYGAVVNNGALVFNRADTALIVSNAISGAGAITNAGPGTVRLAGANSFDGPATVAAGVLQAGNNSALGSTNGGTTVRSGASLDVSGFNLGAEPIFVSGIGMTNVDGTTNGAIFNGSAASASPAVARVTLLGDTVFGAPPYVDVRSNRWDLRAPGGTTGDPSTASLTGAYNLTKVGNNFLGIVSATVDPNLGDIDVQGGILDIEGNTTGLGDPSKTLTVENDATLFLYSATNRLNKQFVLNGNGLGLNGLGTIENANGNNVIVGPMTLNGDVRITFRSTTGAQVGGSLLLSNTITGTGSLAKENTNTLTMAGEADYSGGTTINNGTFILNGINRNTNNTLIENYHSLLVPTIMGGSGTNAGPVFVGDTLWPGLTGRPATFGSGNLSFYGSQTMIFSLGAATTAGGGVNDLLNVNGDLDAESSQIYINPLDVLAASNTYTLVNYTGSLISQFADTPIIAGNVAPARYAFALDQTVPHVIRLTVTAGGGLMRWNNASGNGLWDVATSQNWTNLLAPPPATGLNLYFEQLDQVLLDDTISGAATPTNILTIPAFTVVAPLAITNNSTTDYTITGPGKLSGIARLVKLGSSRLTISSTSNDFTGKITVLGGTLRPDATNALGSAASPVIVTNGGTLDVGGPSFGANATILGAKPVYVSGWGVNNNGAIVNSSSNQQQNAVQNVTLTGDTAFGGPGLAQGSGNPGRWDIRGGVATLSTGGQPYNLYKVGSNQVSLVGCTVDTNLADIHVFNGEFGIETTTSPTLGNPTNTLTVDSGASFEFYQFIGPLNKKLVVNGNGTLPGGFPNIWFNSGVYPSNTIMSVVTLTNGNVVIGGAGSGTFSNVISGPGGATIAGGVTFVATNTYTGDTIISNTGTLFLADNASIGASLNLTLGGGTLNVTGRADGTLTLNSGQTLAGNGTVAGSLNAAPGSTVAPAGTNNAAIGRLNVTTNVTLAGTTVMKLDAGNNTNDVLAAGAALAYGGVLTVTNLNGALAAGQSFKLFNAASYSGAFSATNLPALGGGLGWVWNPAGGTLSVVSTAVPVPQITGIGLAGTTLTLTGSNGPAGGAYVLLESTNVALPLGQWTPVLTNAFDGSGNLNLSTNIINPANAQTFYILQTQ